MPKITHTLWLIVAILAAPAAARAQQAAADALFDSARASMAKGDFAAACEQFRASDQLDPALGTELKINNEHQTVRFERRALTRSSDSDRAAGSGAVERCFRRRAFGAFTKRAYSVGVLGKTARHVEQSQEQQ